MIYEKEIKGDFVTLRSITLEDAEFSYAIRSESGNRETVGQLAVSLDAQREFIKWQMQQPGDYYFVVYNNRGERIGLMGLYDIHDGIGEVGREVINGTPEENMETGLLVDKFAVEIIGLKRITYVIYANNHKNIARQKQLGRTPLKIVVRNGIECMYFEYSVDDENYVRGTEKIKRLLDRIKLQRGVQNGIK